MSQMNLNNMGMNMGNGMNQMNMDIGNNQMIMEVNENNMQINSFMWRNMNMYMTKEQIKKKKQELIHKGFLFGKMMTNQKKMKPG